MVENYEKNLPPSEKANIRKIYPDFRPLIVVEDKFHGDSNTGYYNFPIKINGLRKNPRSLNSRKTPLTVLTGDIIVKKYYTEKPEFFYYVEL